MNVSITEEILYLRTEIERHNEWIGMKLKLEIELSEQAFLELRLAAKKMRMTTRTFAARAVARAAKRHSVADEKVTESLNKFFEENPELVTMEAQQYWEN